MRGSGVTSCVLIDRDDNDAADSPEMLHTVRQQAWKDITEGDNNEDQQEDIFQAARLGRYHSFHGTDWAPHPCGCHSSFIENPPEIDTLYSTRDFLLSFKCLQNVLYATAGLQNDKSTCKEIWKASDSINHLWILISSWNGHSMWKLILHPAY